MLPIGAGPGKAYTAKEQAEMLFRITGREPKFFSVPVALMDIIIGAMELIGKVIPPVGVRRHCCRIYIVQQCSPHRHLDDWLVSLSLAPIPEHPSYTSGCAIITSGHASASYEVNLH